MFFILLLSTILLIVLPFFVHTSDIAEDKCEEYGKAVFTEEISPILSKHTRINKISNCAIESIPLIIGGKKCKPKEFPHMASIGYGSTPYEQLSWACGGTLISHLFILTAAHCLTSRNKGPAQKVKLGAIKLSETNEWIQERLIVEKIPHPSYNFTSKENDLALFKMHQSIEFSPYIRPACLNTKTFTPNTKLIAIGFGKLSYDSTKASEDLMKVPLTLYKDDRCNFTTPNKMLCVGDLKGGHDTCQGDSGGPLQMTLDDPYCMYAIVGVTSFGKFCGFPNSPAAYTNVKFYLDWIERIVWNRN